MIKNKEDYKRYINYEKENYKKSYPNFTKELKNIVKFQKLYRKLEYYTNCKNNGINKIISKILNYRFEKLSIRYCFHIPINTIEEGLCIVHTGPIYINTNTSIGKNVRIHPMTTIGKNIGVDGKSPILGDGVWIGPGAKIYGNIKIGNNVVIGTNSVVNKNIPSDVTVAGVPAKIINNNGYKDYFKKS